MKIGIILSPYGIAKPSGLSRFILNTALEIIGQSPSDNFVLFIKGKADIQDFKGIKNVEIKFMPNNFLWKDVAYLRNRDIDVWLYNNLNPPILFCPKKFVSIALDFGLFYKLGRPSLKQRFAIKAQYLSQKKALMKSAKVISISESTQRDIIKFFPGIDKTKLAVSMSGFTPPCETFEPKEVKNLPKVFFLLVGVIKPRKNQIAAVKAFIQAKQEGLSGDMVITGKGEGEYFDEVMKIIEATKYKDCIHYIGYRTDEEMAYIYKKTRSLIVPSIIEGFGMPVIEAMSCGTPVIVSDNPALVEVGGSAVSVCRARSEEDFKKAMFFMSDSKNREEAIKKGYLQANKFSWKVSAEKYINELHEATE